MPHASKRLLNHLPGIYRTSPHLDLLLTLFENFLFGEQASASGTARGADRFGEAAGIEGTVDAISALFDPRSTPDEFLPWLSQWVALSDYGGLSGEQRRRLIRKIIPLYAMRGTKPYLERLLQLFTPDSTRIHVDDTPSGGFTVGEARIGIDTLLAPGRLHWFKVTLTLPAVEEGGSAETRRTAIREQLRRVIDLAKPVHTVFDLELTEDEFNHSAK